jgi:hypothetical protein
MIKTIPQVLREHQNECAKAAFTRYRHAIMPIYGSNERGIPDHIGSGVLLKLPEGHCLLTAAHVIDKNEYTTLYTGVSRAEELSLEFAITIPPNGDRSRDHHDFALARLSANLVSRLEGAKFIEEAEISKSVASPVGRSYTCLGFPNSKNKVSYRNRNNLTPVLGTYTGSGLAHQKPVSAANEDDNILVDFSFKYSRDENGNRVNSISPRGYSGGAIVDLGRLSDPATLDQACEPLLAALLIEAHKVEKAIFGTRLIKILSAIRTAKWFDKPPAPASGSRQ